MEKVRCKWAQSHPLMAAYHDEYGIPIHDDDLLFERLVLEQMQAGLSWLIVLKKRAGMQKAFSGFSVEKVARFNARSIERLLQDENIIRNRRKIEAAIENARRIRTIQKNGDSFDQWLRKRAVNKPTLDEWVKLFKQDFTFTGKEIVNEFLTSLGILSAKHDPECWVSKRPHKASFIRGV